MTNIIFSKKMSVFIILIIICLPLSAGADENLAIYGLKGYAYTYSPIPSDGLNLQIGGMYSMFEWGNINNRNGHIWAFPVSLTYGNGTRFEISAATHWENWENTDYDVSESGTGDVFVGGKFRFLGTNEGNPLDIALMPYAFISTGNRDKSIGDLYLYNPTDKDDFTGGINLLLGHRWKQFYFASNIGINYIDTDLDYIEKSTLFFGLTVEYQISETATSYIEFVNNENKNKYQCFTCEEGIDEDIQELGLGFVWIKDRLGIKIHAGTGWTATSPDFIGMAMINWNLY